MKNPYSYFEYVDFVVLLRKVINMRFNDTIQAFRKVIPYFVEIIEKGAMSLARSKTSIYFQYTLPPSLSDSAKFILEKTAENQANKIEAYSFGKLLHSGVKLFRPRHEQLEMLEHMSLNIQFEDYVQPFDTLVIEFPESYFKEKRVHCPQAGRKLFDHSISSEHEPAYVIVHHELTIGCILITLMFNSNLSIKTAICPEGDTLEHYIESFTEKDKFQNTLATTDEEWEVTRACIHSALNYCLLLDEIGCKSNGPENPKLHQRLSHFVSAGLKRNDPAERRERDRANLLAQPILYELNQNVKLHRTVEECSELSSPTGKILPPHHRRGYYKMQHFGVGGMSRKRIRISPVFVNKHLFLGKMSDTKVTYS